MESLESLLRDELNGTVPPRASVSELIANVRRQRRRRTASSVAAALSVMAVAIAGLLVPQLGDRSEQVTNPSVIDPSIFEGIVATAFRTTGIPVVGRFLDADRGYLLMMRCNGIPDEQHPETSLDKCTLRLVATTDGTHFADRPALPSGGMGDFRTSLWVFNDGALVYDHAAKRWVSNDAGLTWREVPTAPAGKLTSIPEGAKLIADFYEDNEAPYVLTSDGSSYTLTPAPPGAAILPAYLNSRGGEPTDGSFFLTRDDDLLVSTDRGVTWQPADSDGRRAVGVLGSDDRRMYAFSDRAQNDDQGVPPLVLVSEDHGLSWSSILLPALTPILGSTPGVYNDDNLRTFTPAVLPAGGMVITDSARVWRLPHDGTGFEPVPSDRTVAVVGFDGMVLALRGDATAIAFYLTRDGTHWHKADLP